MKKKHVHSYPDLFNTLNLGLVLVSVVLGMYLNWRAGLIALLVLAVWAILFPIKTKILVKIGLLIIFFIPVSQMAKKSMFAEDLGIVLCGILVLLVYKFIQNARRRE